MGKWGVWRKKERGRMGVWAVRRRPWGVWWVFDWVQLYGGAEWRLMDV